MTPDEDAKEPKRFGQPSEAAAALTPQDMEDLENIIMEREPQGGQHFKSFASRRGGAPAPTHAADAEAGKPSGDRER